MKAEGAGPRGSVDAYLSQVPPKMRALLQKLHKMIQKTAPGATEMISYRMPAFYYHGMLVYYAAFKDHASFFVGSAASRSKFAKPLKPFATGKGTVRFSVQKPLPLELVRRIVRSRMKENEARAAKRRDSRRTRKARDSRRK